MAAGTTGSGDEDVVTFAIGMLADAARLTAPAGLGAADGVSGAAITPAVAIPAGAAAVLVGAIALAAGEGMTVAGSVSVVAPSSVTAALFADRGSGWTRARAAVAL